MKKRYRMNHESGQREHKFYTLKFIRKLLLLNEDIKLKCVNGK
jgi:hypothetical protein